MCPYKKKLRAYTSLLLYLHRLENLDLPVKILINFMA